MKLFELVKNLDCEIYGDLDIEISGIFYDSKNVCEKSVFVCINGENSDGHNFVFDAIKNGAIAVVCEKKLENISVAQIVVNSTRKALCVLFSNFYNNPQDKLKIVGITGTNGKTTTSFLLKSILEQSGKSVGLIGTQGVYFGKQYFQTGLTTPDPQTLFWCFNEMVKNQIEYVVMEVSAHALELEKTFGIVFDVGVFTNLTQDHLDFFKTMGRYKKTKLKLFENSKIKSAVLNFDDNVGIEISKKLSVPFLSYGIYNPSDIFSTPEIFKNGKTNYFINLLDDVIEINSNLIGEHNISNSLAAAGAAAILGCDVFEIKLGLEKLNSVDGRLNIFKLKNGATAIVDFAHTPDGIEKALCAIKKLSFKKITTVFGCSGNRDKDKRHKMGSVAEKLSDFVVLTTDNPCYENPELIFDDIEIGMKKNAHNKFVNRTEAVMFALSNAKQGECVAILGKGAETYQDINGIKVPYSDIEVVESFNKNFFEVEKNKGETV